MVNPGKRFWVVFSIVALTLGGIAWFTVTAASTPATIATPSMLMSALGTAFGGADVTPPVRYRFEVIVQGRDGDARNVSIDTTSKDVREECFVYPGEARAKVLLAAGMPQIRGTVDPKNDNPVVSILGREVVIEPARLVVDGDSFELPPAVDKISLWERDGTVRILAGSVEVAKFTR